ncbi:hypothetical protein R1sor_019719 [Riccia sorocarpa]|uniref:Uncharacterized protein n=1 Tax=Riccia sorocarpa TaxID=122646 RepID=A0ABD3IHM8_9MARC
MKRHEGNGDQETAAANDLIAQLDKLTVAAGDQAESSVHISKKVSALKFAQKLEQEPGPPLKSCTAQVIFGGPLPLEAAVENPRATLLWDPSKKRPPVVTVDIERDESGTRACRLQLPIRFLDLPEVVQGTGHQGPTREDPFVSRSSNGDCPPKPGKPQASSKGSSSPVPPSFAAFEPEISNSDSASLESNRSGKVLTQALVVYEPTVFSAFQAAKPASSAPTDIPLAPIIVEVTDSDEVLPDREP